MVGGCKPLDFWEVWVIDGYRAPLLFNSNGRLGILGTTYPKIMKITYLCPLFLELESIHFVLIPLLMTKFKYV